MNTLYYVLSNFLTGMAFGLVAVLAFIVVLLFAALLKMFWNAR